MQTFASEYQKKYYSWHNKETEKRHKAQDNIMENLKIQSELQNWERSYSRIMQNYAEILSDFKEVKNETSMTESIRAKNFNLSYHEKILLSLFLFIDTSSDTLGLDTNKLQSDKLFSNGDYKGKLLLTLSNIFYQRDKGNNDFARDNIKTSGIPVSFFDTYSRSTYYEFLQDTALSYKKLNNLKLVKFAKNLHADPEQPMPYQEVEADFMQLYREYFEQIKAEEIILTLFNPQSISLIDVMETILDVLNICFAETVVTGLIGLLLTPFGLAATTILGYIIFAVIIIKSLLGIIKNLIKFIDVYEAGINDEEYLETKHPYISQMVKTLELIDGILVIATFDFKNIFKMGYKKLIRLARLSRNKKFFTALTKFRKVLRQDKVKVSFLQLSRHFTKISPGIHVGEYAKGANNVFQFLRNLAQKKGYTRASLLFAMIDLCHKEVLQAAKAYSEPNNKRDNNKSKKHYAKLLSKFSLKIGTKGADKLYQLERTLGRKNIRDMMAAGQELYDAIENAVNTNNNMKNLTGARVF